MNSEFFTALDELEKQKGIPKQYMLDRVEAALINAYKRECGGSANVRVNIDSQKQDVKVYQCRTVVEEVTNPTLEISLADAQKISRRYVLGSVVEKEMKTKEFGRLSAQTAKQVIIQGIREIEKSNQFREYDRKREEIISALVTKVNPDDGSVYLDTGTSEVLLSRDEMISTDDFVAGDHIKVFVTEVHRDAESSPVVTLSRTHPNMVKRMFELVVPEIAQGIVVIRGICREAGSRTKMAVFSRDPDVDPIGACLGPNSSRISEVINELNGEKIDVVLYSEKPEEYITSALSPATIQSVEFDGERSAKVYVNSDQLSLAIGKEGQNARLAARLTGFKIDIKGTKRSDLPGFEN